MPAREVAPRLLSWASDVEQSTVDQAARAARLPFVAGHVALMPDAHVGIGATVGSVIPTDGAIIPAAVGVDIGCGMIATETDLLATDLPESLRALMPLIEQRIPAGVGKAHAAVADGTDVKLAELGTPHTALNPKQERTVAEQFGTLGSGNHFVEVCLDERDHVWTVLHSGSRGIGNQLASKHIDAAKKLAKAWFIPLEDPDLAYFVQGSPEFTAYVRDMLWAQRYAMASRQRMAEAAIRSLFEVVGRGSVVRTINCHHNFTQQEHHHGRDVWVTRKGAIKADVGDEGVIPGSMGTRSYVVTGKGNPASYNSCSHGAGRRLSRGQARKTLSVESLAAAMGDRTWNADKARVLLDEHPEAYKDIDQVMADQSDLVEVQHTLRQVFNYKGT
ncbi:MAG: RtcB family protein [Frankiaceae bacterium]|nr:RtcB family protein [Frankiaceae bacterium]MBV9369953.1 RtcB family protein [Frankiales bacterium]